MSMVVIVCSANSCNVMLASCTCTSRLSVSPNAFSFFQQQHKKQGQNRMEALKKRAKDAQLKTKSNRLSKMSIEGRGL